MSQENVQVVRRAFDAFDREGLDGLAPHLDPEIEWTTTGAYIEPATYCGREEVRRYLGSMIDEFDDLHNEAMEVIDAGDQVVVVHRISGRGKLSGAPVDLTMASVGSVSEGKVVRIRNYPTKDEALEAAGLRE